MGTVVQMLLEPQSVGGFQKPLPPGPMSEVPSLACCFVASLVGLEAGREQRLNPEGQAAGFLETDTHYQERRNLPPPAAPNEQNL